MQVTDLELVSIYIIGMYGIAWSDATRFATFNLAGIGFLVNLFTEIGGPFSLEAAIAFLVIILGAMMWLVFDVLGSILAVINALLTNLTTDDNYIEVPDTSTTNLRDVFIDDDDEFIEDNADRERPPRP